MKARFLSASICALITVSAFSQDAPPASTSSSQPAPAQAGAPPASAGTAGAQRFDLRFTGGTVKEFIAAVSEKLGRPVNVVIAKGSETAPIPPLEVYHATLRSLFKAVNVASNGRASFTTADNDESQEAIWSFQDPVQANVLAEREVRYFPIAEFLSRFTVEDISTAIETGWELQGGTPPSGPKPTINFHEETKLLICAASSQQLDVIPQVLKGLAQVPFPKNDKIIRKASRLIVPKLDFREATVQESAEFLRRKSILVDDDPNEQTRGVNIALDQTDAPAEHRVTLSLTNVSVMDALKMVASLAKLKLEARDAMLVLKTVGPDSKDQDTVPLGDSDMKAPRLPSGILAPGVAPIAPAETTK